MAVYDNEFGEVKSMSSEVKENLMTLKGITHIRIDSVMKILTIFVL